MLQAKVCFSAQFASSYKKSKFSVPRNTGENACNKNTVENTLVSLCCLSLLQNGPEMTGVASTLSIISTRIDLLITTSSSKGHFSKILDVLLKKIGNRRNTLKIHKINLMIQLNRYIYKCLQIWVKYFSKYLNTQSKTIEHCWTQLSVFEQNLTQLNKSKQSWSKLNIVEQN